MKLNYRILAVDPAESSIMVRYFTDVLSERDLSTEPGEKKAEPDRCRTDYNLTLYKPDLDGQELHDFIVRSAPVDWLKLRESPPAQLPAAALIGRVHSVKLTADKEIDISEALDGQPVDAKGMVKLIKIRRRTNDGTLAFPVDGPGMAEALVPYHELVTAHPGFVGKSWDIKGKEWRRVYTLDRVEAARALHAKLTDLSIPAIATVENLTSQFAAEQATTLETHYKLTRSL